MRLPENNNDTSGLSAGEEFVKKIGKFGAIMFLVLSIIGTILMFVSGRTAPEQAETPEATERSSAYSSPFASHHRLF